MSNRLSTEERLGRQSPQRLIRYFVMFMAVLYCGLGVFMWVAPATMLPLQPTVRHILGVVFIFYGIIRFVRAYRQMFSK
ncbi:hypothetical protein BXP70_11970 [Hymenobacter crusticola]|uniref:Uncharacterized protein n=1 Tax=Hymenobacter crusticola TaxID=1770526 RepID=A0A243WDE5_9BACT|nr:hypothetical protein BXP70_11970 [Hymenobacter crusticola]